MEKTLHIPDELARRLEELDVELPEILEAGLQAVEHRVLPAGRVSQNERQDASELPPEWGAALSQLIEKRPATAPAPSLEELMAYGEGRFKPEDEEAWLDRLAADGEAARDLADFMDFKRSPTPSDSGTGEALRHLRAKVAETAVEKQPANMAEPVVKPRPTRWLPLAAALIMACGMLILGLQISKQPSEPRYATVLDVATSRGVRPFPISSADQVLLILPSDRAESGAPERRMQITRVGGGVIYEGDYRAMKEERNRLYLVLPRDVLKPGLYQVEIIAETDTGDSTLAQEYRFSIEDLSGR